MKYIIKQSSPTSLENYKKEIGACFDELPKIVKDELRHSLFDEQGGICCYCGKRISDNYTSVIEHLYPRGLKQYVHLQLEYTNLLCSCDGGVSDRTGKSKAEKLKCPSYCDNKKNNRVLKVHPLCIDCEKKFGYDEEGYIYGLTPEARETIEILGLDCATLVNLRKAAIEPYVEQQQSDSEWNQIIERLNKKTNGIFYSFCFAVIYYIKNFKMAS